LNSDIPGVKINKGNLCQECVGFKNEISSVRIDKRVLVKETEKKFLLAKRNKNIYDVLVMFSGGKDSAYLLHLLKNKYNLRVLAFCVVAPFLNSKQLDNITEITKKLGVDLIKFNLDYGIYKKFMRFGLYRYGKKLRENGFNYFGCSLCRYFINLIPYNFALFLGIPIVVAGIDKNQSDKAVLITDTRNKKEELNKRFKYLNGIFRHVFKDKFSNSIYDFNINCYSKKQLPDLIYPLTYFQYSTDLAFKILKKNGIDREIINSGIGQCCSLFTYLVYLSYKITGHHSHIKLMSKKCRTKQSFNFGKIKTNKRDKILKFLECERKALFFMVKNKNIDYKSFKKMFPDIPNKSFKEMKKMYKYMKYFK